MSAGVIPVGKRLAMVLAMAVTTMAAAACGARAVPVGATAPSDASWGPRPELPPRKPYVGPTPQTFTTDQGLTVWWLPRPGLQLVSMALVLPYGSAQDPPDKPGLAFATAEMLDEGAGDRDALGVGGTIADLGTSLSIEVSRDGSHIALTVLRRHAETAFDLLGDLVSRPRFDAGEWKRTAALWTAYLQARGDDAVSAVAIVGRAVVYGRDSPYGHPSRGQLEAVSRITLDDLRAFHRSHWRPDRATLIVVGDLNRSELDSAVDRALARWVAPPLPAPARIDSSGPLEPRPRLVLVDDPRAPQSVVLIIRPGVAAGDPDAALLPLVNTALGGAFTSRLNQSLREDKGWTYGVESAFFETRAVGPFLVLAPVEKRVTAAAIGRALREIERMAEGGLTAEEHVMVRAQDHTRFMETYETVERTTARLATLAELGLAPGADGIANQRRQAATLAELAGPTRKHLDMGTATVVVVGPAKEIEAQLELLELGTPVRYDADGQPVGRAAGAARDDTSGDDADEPQRSHEPATRQEREAAPE